jgi:hypothetical protein
MHTTILELITEIKNAADRVEAQDPDTCDTLIEAKDMIEKLVGDLEAADRAEKRNLECIEQADERKRRFFEKMVRERNEKFKAQSLARFFQAEAEDAQNRLKAYQVD